MIAPLFTPHTAMLHCSVAITIYTNIIIILTKRSDVFLTSPLGIECTSSVTAEIILQTLCKELCVHNSYVDFALCFVVA